ncbi:MATE family efflux transporter [Thermoanaerobacteraceae bacterium SP2]|nr:MATE family efflux transporter [Thermoanaerobacteraceae bacterium SP2]
MDNMEKKYDSAVLKKGIFNLAWPAILEMVLSTAVWIFDTAMVGRLSAEALSAVGLGSQLAYTVTFVFAALGVGTAAMVARFTGAGEPEKVDHVAAQSFLIACVIGLFLGILNFLGAGFFFSLVMKDPRVIILGTDYMRIVSVGIVFMVPTLVLNSALRGAGNTRLPMISALLGNSLNILGDYVLIFGHFGFPRLEVSGAAVATSIAQICGAAVTIGYVTLAKKEIKLKFKEIMKIDPRLLWQLVDLSLPASLEEFSYSGSRLISSMWIANLGTVAFAANQVAVSAESMSFMPGYGFSIAASTLVGQNLGSKRKDLAEDSGWESMKLALLLMGAVGILFLAAPGWLIGFFTSIPEVRDLAAVCIRVGAFEQPTIAISMTLSGALKGAGDTKGTFLISLISTWLIRLPLIFIMVFILKKGLAFVWLATVIQFFLEALLMVLRFRQGRWKDIRL